MTGYDVCVFDQTKYKETVTRYDEKGTNLGYLLNAYDVYDLVLAEDAYDAEGSWICTTMWRYEHGQITYDAAEGVPGRS